MKLLSTKRKFQKQDDAMDCKATAPDSAAVDFGFTYTLPTD